MKAGKDEGRKKEVRNNLSLFNVKELLDDKKFTTKVSNNNDLLKLSESLTKKYSKSLEINSFAFIVKQQ